MKCFFLIKKKRRNLQLRRNNNDWEVEEASSLIFRLEEAPLGNGECEDRRMWVKNQLGPMMEAS